MSATYGHFERPERSASLLNSPAGEALWAQDREKSRGASRTKNVSETERWISIASGSALVLFGLRRLSLFRLLSAGAGAALVYRGLTGHCHAYQTLGINTAEHPPQTAVPAQQGVHVKQSVTIDRPAEELFAYWREVSNLPRVMRHVASVEPIDERRSHWTAKGPLDVTLEWDAEIFNERQGEFIAWRSLPGGDLETAGSVHFQPLSDGRGTEVRVSMKYNPPAGKLGDQVASLFGQGLEQQLAADLQRFQRQLETGQLPTAAGR